MSSQPAKVEVLGPDRNVADRSVVTLVHARLNVVPIAEKLLRSIDGRPYTLRTVTKLEDARNALLGADGSHVVLLDSAYIEQLDRTLLNTIIAGTPPVPVVVFIPESELSKSQFHDLLRCTDFLTTEINSPLKVDHILRRALERKSDRNFLESQLYLQNVISEISMSFVNIESDQLDQRMTQALERFAALTNAETSFVFQRPRNGSLCSMNAEWCRIGLSRMSDYCQNRPFEIIEPLLSVLSDDHAATSILVRDISAKAAELKEALLFRGVHELVIARLGAPGKELGLMGFGVAEEGRRWSQEILAALGLVGQIFANALQRKTAWFAVKDSERRFKALIDNLGEGVIYCDVDDKVLHINPRFCDLTQYSLSELSGRAITDLLILPEDVSIMRAHTALRLTGVGETYQIRVRRKDGSYFWAQIRGTPIYDPQNEIVGTMGAVIDITEAKVMSEALREREGQYLSSEERFRKYFELPLIGMAMSSSTGDWTDVNRKMCDILGYERSELLSMKWTEHTHPDDLEKCNRQHERALNGEIDSYSLDKRFIKKNGSILHASISVGTVRKLDGSINYFVVLVQDITKRKGAEQALQTQRSYLRQVLDVIPALVFARDREGRYTLANQAVAELAQISPEEIIGQTEVEVNPNIVLAKKFQEEDREVLRTGRSLVGPEQPIYHPIRRETRWYETVKRPLFDEHGKVYQVLGVGIDLTERKRAEEALRILVEATASATAEDFFHSLVRHLAEVLGTKFALVGRLEGTKYSTIQPLAVWEDGQYAELGAYELEGTPCDEVVGRTLRYFPNDVCKRFPANPWLRKHKIASYMGAPIFDSNGKALGILSVLDDRPMRDWSPARWILRIFAMRAGGELERLNSEEAARRLQHQLLQAQKMEAIGQLAAGIAHDLNNSLGAVVGHLQLMKLSPTLPRDLDPSVDIALSGCERASSLIEQLLGFSRQGKYNIETLELHAVVEDTIKFLGRVIGKDVQIELSGLSEGLYVPGDEGQLHQALTNLIINAKHAMPTGGQITFTFGKVSVMSPRQFNLNATPGDYVTLAIQDTGCGIPEDNLEKIFEPFYTTKDSKHGTGLGLSMVYGIVHNHGGWIDVTSAPDAGTTFTIYLPQAERVQIEQSQDSSTDEEPETSGTVLVIDDEESLVDLTTTFLSRSGFGSKGFTSASEALDWYREHAPEIDLVVLDMKMPRMSGVECFKALRKINPAVKVVILSGYIQDESAHQLLELGARRFFHKPLKYPELMQWISENIRD